MDIVIYTDGGCSGNPGPGGWAFVMLLPDGRRIESFGGEKATTNNRMELNAVIEALTRREALAAEMGGDADTGLVKVFTDSQYVKNGITTWIHGWKRNGWRTASKDPVKNRELWEKLDAVNARVKPEWHWVKGHAGHEHNERCDDLVQEGIAANR